MRITCIFVPVVFSLLVLPASAQETGVSEMENTSESMIETMIVVGSRTQNRSSEQMTVPVDTLDQELLGSQSEMLEALTSAIPSYNVGREPISDAATLMRPANMRGLPSDSTLVLVNGKRRHRGAVIGEFISGINKGAQGVDINPLSGIAVKRVEVLRDGASAHYGSDAIAGVLNFVLEDDPNVRKMEMQYGHTYEGDGEQLRISGAYGMSIGAHGFLTASLDMQHQEPTIRSSQDPQAIELVRNGFTNVDDPVVKWGSPEVKDNYKFILNGAVPMEMGELYVFSNWATRDVDGSFFFRNPNTRQNVFVIGSGADARRLVADVGGQGCPEVVVGDALASNADLQNLISDRNCFVFNEWFPGGFTPRFGGIVNDRGSTFGWRGHLPEDEYHFDFSISLGRSQAIYEIHNTVNASYGSSSPTDFYLGESIQSEQLISFEWQTVTDIDKASDMNIAWGFQYHREGYEIVQGDEASWRRGQYADAGFSVGSNGFQGYSRDVAGDFSRYNLGAYAEFDVEWTEDLLLNLAARYEDFSDFGGTLNGKFSGRYQVRPDMALRGSVSTGFRAPSVGQSNLRRTSTGFSGGRLVEQVVLPPDHPVSVLKGGKALEPENSVNGSLGAVFGAGDFNFSLDWFYVAVSNRISLIGLNLSEEDRNSLLAAGVTGVETVTRVNFYVNDFDTSTIGVDFVAETIRTLGDGQLDLSFLVNGTFTEVTSGFIDSSLDEITAREIEDALPDYRFNVTARYSQERWSTQARINYYGDVYELLFTDPTLGIETDALAVIDVETTYRFSPIVNVTAGLRNLFNTRPDKHQFANTYGFLGADYPLTHPAGFDGGSFYVRLGLDW